MKSIETGGGVSADDLRDEEGQDLTEESAEKKFPSREMVALWKRYGWQGEAPVEGSIAEERLKEYCSRYMTHVLKGTDSPIAKKLDTQSSRRKSSIENSEDYFAQFRKPKVDESAVSEASRRDLHNQIALMVTGGLRSGMDIVTAERITEFASDLTYGCSVAEAAERKLSQAEVV